MNADPNTRRLRIAQVAPLSLGVPPKGYGGVERVIHALTEALMPPLSYAAL